MSKHSAELLLMRRIVDGLAGWVTYHQAGHPSTHYDEHLFYEPIRTIVEGRHWIAKQQQTISKFKKGSGGSGSLDFVIFRQSRSNPNRTRAVLVEVKYIRSGNITQDLKYLRADIDKLRTLKYERLACASLLENCDDPSRFLLVISREDAFCKIIKSKSRKNSAVVKMLKRAHTQKIRGIYRTKAASHLKRDHQWQVIAMSESQWPK